MDLYFSVLYQQAAAAPVGQSHAYARIFHGTGNPCIGFALIDVFYGFQCFRNTRGIIGNLSIRQHLSRTDGITVTDLPGRNAGHLCQQVQIPLGSKAGLGYSEASVCTGRRIIRVHRLSVYIDYLEIIRPRGMCTGTLQHGPAQRSVGPCVRYDYRLHRGQYAVLVTGCCDIHPHWMTFWMDDNAFLPG